MYLMDCMRDPCKKKIKWIAKSECSTALKIKEVWFWEHALMLAKS